LARLASFSTKVPPFRPAGQAGLSDIRNREGSRYRDRWHRRIDFARAAFVQGMQIVFASWGFL